MSPVILPEKAPMVISYNTHILNPKLKFDYCMRFQSDQSNSFQSAASKTAGLNTASIQQRSQ